MNGKVPHAQQLHVRWLYRKQIRRKHCSCYRGFNRLSSLFIGTHNITCNECLSFECRLLRSQWSGWASRECRDILCMGIHLHLKAARPLGALEKIEKIVWQMKVISPLYLPSHTLLKHSAGRTHEDSRINRLERLFDGSFVTYELIAEVYVCTSNYDVEEAAKQTRSQSHRLHLRSCSFIVWVDLQRHITIFYNNIVSYIGSSWVSFFLRKLTRLQGLLLVTYHRPNMLLIHSGKCCSSSVVICVNRHL